MVLRRVEISDIPDKVNKVGMYSTLFDSRGPSFDKLNKTYTERFHRNIYQYALNAYDAEWVLALSYSEVYGKLSRKSDQMKWRQTYQKSAKNIAMEITVSQQSADT